MLTACAPYNKTLKYMNSNKNKTNQKETLNCREQRDGQQWEVGGQGLKQVTEIKSTLTLMSTEYYIKLLNHCIIHQKIIQYGMLTAVGLK